MRTYSGIVIDTSAIILTLRCNLKCKLCCTASPYQNPPPHFSVKSIEHCVKRYFETVKYIRKLSLGGGEPMLRTDLPEIVEAILEYKKQFDILEIITNGTIVPKDAVLDILQKNKDTMFVMIDNYGKHSPNAEKIDAILNEKGINHKVRIYHGTNAHMGGWVDLGDYTHKHSHNETKALLRECVIATTPKQHTGTYTPMPNKIIKNALLIPYLAMTNGLLHRCARSYSTMLAGRITKDSDSFVDTMDESSSINEIQDKIIRMVSSEYLSACEYCNGFSGKSKRFEPAEQLI